MLLPVVLAGGVGSRLWPFSKPSSPKQFAVLPGRSRSLFAETVMRLRQLPQCDAKPLICCSHSNRFMAADQLQALGGEQQPLLLEPVGRNTAPAIALAAMQASQLGKDPVLLVCPSDHLIEDNAAFEKAINVSLGLADDGFLVTFGITPESPETGYGYIECGDGLSNQGGWRVESFIEKPALDLAGKLVAAQRYLWNSGIFVFRASNYLNQLNQFAPDIYRDCQRSFLLREKSADFIVFPNEQFSQCRSESIDRAVMEKTEKAAVVKVDMGWSDLGNWGSLWQSRDQDGNGNNITGNVSCLDVEHSLIHAGSRKVVVAGLTDAAVIETPDAVLIAGAGYANAVSEFIEKLRNENSNNDSLQEDGQFYSKPLHISADYELYLKTVPAESVASWKCECPTQEDWIMVKGVLQVSAGSESFTITQGEAKKMHISEDQQLNNLGASEAELLVVRQIVPPAD